MKCWTDTKTEQIMCEPDCADEWLQMIWTVGANYDGCTTKEELLRLIDDLVDMSQNARECMREGRLYCADEKVV